MKQVDVYARISADKTGEAFGVTNQLNAIKAYCDARGWVIADEYVDNNVSANKTGVVRPEFQRLLSRPVKRDVVAYNWDRLVRVSLDVEAILDQEDAMTVFFVEVGEIDLSTPMGRALARILTAMATAEIENKRVRSLLANSARANSGIPHWNRRPVGYNTDGSLVPEEASIITTSIQEVINGKSLSQVARDWNAAGLYNYRNKPWTPQGVRHVLTNRRLYGELVYKGEVMPKSLIEPTVSAEKFYELQGVLSAPERHTSGFGGRKPQNLLTGIALCGICNDGTTMNAAVNEMAGGRIPTYQCSKRRHNLHPREEMDTYMEHSITSTLYNNPQSLNDGSNSAAHSEVQRLRGQLRQFEDIASQIGAQEYLRITKDLREQLAAAEEAAKSSALVELFANYDASSVGHVINWWDSLSLDRRRAIILHLYSSVTLTHKPRNSKTDRIDHLVLVER